MPRWNRTALPLTGALALGVALALAQRSPGADDETARAIATLKGVTREGRGNEDAAPAWKALVARGGAALFPTLEAFDENNPIATNWLRAAVDAIAENENAAKRPLPADKLEAFAKDTTFAPPARRVAYELLVAQDPAAKDRVLPGFLNDRSPDLRRDAIARELDALERSGRPALRADLEKLFTHARDKDQVDLLARKIEENGGKVNVSEHFGFITHADLIAPFDNTAGKAFTTAYPPETATDTAGTFKGKNGVELKWSAAQTADKYGKFDLNRLIEKPPALERHTDAVAYARAVVVADKQTPCEVRVTCITSVQIFLNGQKLFERDEYHHGAAFDAHVGKGTLKKGENVILLKVLQNNQKESWAKVWSFQMRVCDNTGGPLPLRQKITDNGKDGFIKLGFIPDAPVKKEEKK